MAGLMNF